MPKLISRTSGFSIILLVLSSFARSTSVIPPTIELFFGVLFYFSSLLFIVSNLKFLSIRNKTLKNILLIYIWYLIFYLGSALLSPNLTHGLWIFINTALLSVLFIFSSANYFMKNGISFFVKTYFYIAFSIMLLSFLVYVLDISVTYYGDVDVNSLERSVLGFKFSGLYQNQNQFGILLASLTILALFLLTTKEIAISRTLLIFSIVMSFILLLLTLSRASTLFLIVGAGTYSLLLPASRSSIVIVSFVLLVSLYVFTSYFELDALIERFSNTSTSGRDLIWEEAISKGWNNVLFGLGPNQFIHINVFGEKLSAHNYYINNFANIGLPGITFYILGFLSIVYCGIKQYFAKSSNSKFKTHFLAFGVSYSLGLAFNQFFESTAFNPGHFAGLLFLFSFGMMLSFLNN